ncbi:hypothetical protein [Motilimonas eburnea]|uniref:hypothetical protein n=1 Tax=Motilimonas eburnea TaxID=1737488 RepID=UPI001E5B7A16|nr:hypothetical protein [Motilimonas eburnea]MCE2571703.1 hypothetical protein [Motilimonas eburnea]
MKATTKRSELQGDMFSGTFQAIDDVPKQRKPRAKRATVKTTSFRKMQMKRQPHWDDPRCIEHALDKDLIQKIESGDSKYLNMVMLNPDFDLENKTCHFVWTDADIDLLWQGMLQHTFDKIHNIMNFGSKGKGNLGELQTEADWIETKFFVRVLEEMGYHDYARQIQSALLDMMPEHINK